MNCPRHASQKMTLLLTSWVCDVCDPPKATASPMRNGPVDDWSVIHFSPINSTIPFIPIRDLYGYMLCPNCGLAAIDGYYAQSDSADLNLQCYMKHVWSHAPTAGDRVKFRASGNLNDYKFDGQFWNPIT